jgi:hypothetical protein
MRNNKYVLLNNNKIIIISDYLNVCLLLFIDKMLDNNNLDIEKQFKDWYIQEYLEGIILNKNIFFNFKKVRFEDEYSNKIIIDDDIINKINKYIYTLEIYNINNYKPTKKDIIDTQTNLDIFIPLSINETKTENIINTEFINKLEKENKEIDIDFIKKRIDELTQIKNKENEKIKDIKNNISEKKEIINKEKCDTQTKKYKLKYEKEKWNELKRKYDINYNIYITFKDEIKNKKREHNDIPEIFIHEYNIFEKIFNLNINKEELFNIYLDEKKNSNEIDLFTKYNNLFEDNNIIIDDNSDQSSSEHYDDNE